MNSDTEHLASRVVVADALHRWFAVFPARSEAMTDPAQQYDAFSQVVQERLVAIRRLVPSFPSEESITEESLERAQRMAQRLDALVKEFNS